MNKKKAKNSWENSKKRNSIISHTDEVNLIDTIYYNKETEFIVYNRLDRDIKIFEKVTLNRKEYFPISADSNYITNNVLLLPSELTDYWTIEGLLEEIKAYISEYVDISDNFLSMSIYYVLMTYVYDRFSEIPYLRAIWDYWSGKSRLLNVLWRICYNPVFTNWWTSVSALFRMTDKIRWTLILDEADFQYSETTNEIIKLLNCWYAKWNSILRADWEGFEPRSYNVYWPKLIGGRFEFRDKATESRCIVEIMKKTNRKDLKLNLNEEFYEKSNNLRNKLYRFRYAYFDKIIPKEERIDWIEPRLNQILNPIFTLMSYFWKEEDKTKLIEYFQKKQEEIKQDRRLSLEWTIFGIIKEKTKDNWYISYSDIVDSLKEFDWWYHNITPRKLWSLLRQFEILPERKNSWYYVNISKNGDKLGQIYKTFWLED